MRILIAVVALLLAPISTASAQEPPPWLRVEDGVSQPQFSLADAIEETVFVQSEADSDGNGRPDRVRIRISRPRETETQGIDVPVVFEHSPYRGPVGSPANHPVDVDVLPQELSESSPRARVARARGRARPDLPGGLDDRFVPRGYAVVLGESVGTGGSDGCPTIGDASETLGARAVIDWLNGRAPGFDEAGAPLVADWTTGAVGMIGTSYNGTLPNQVATTGVEGLETIVPVSAISSWYDYYRANGLVVAPHSQAQGAGENDYLGEDTDVLALYTGTEARMNGPCAHVLLRLRERQNRVDGDDTAFWRARDWLPGVGGIRASAFVVHGLNDWNVKTKAFADWWYRLAAAGVPRKLWLHRGGHGGPQGDAATEYVRTVDRWFDHELFGVANGVDAEPRVTIQREDGEYAAEADWPAPGAAPVELVLGASAADAIGTLSPSVAAAGAVPRVRQWFVDRGRDLDTDDVLLPGPDALHPNRLVYRSAVLSRDVRLSGTPFVELRVAVRNRRAANLTAVLVDYGAPGSGDPPVMVTRGWIDVQNRRGPARTTPIVSGREYAYRFDLQPDDHVFRAGRRIGLVVVSTDHDYTLRPLPGTELSLHPARSRLRLPVVGGTLGA